MTAESVTRVGSKSRVGWEQGQGALGTGKLCVGDAPRVSRERSPRVDRGRASS